MITSSTRRVVLLGAISALLSTTSFANLSGYWPLNETSGTQAPNAVAGGTAATLFNGATWVQDDVRGRVLEFDGIDGYANAGTIPALDLPSMFTWSFWSLDTTGPTTSVIIGNRYDPNGVDSVPREFTKFTTMQFEWHHDGIGENVDYPDIPSFQWVHNAVVKDGNHLISYRNGLVNGVRTITAGLLNPQPFYFGGDKTAENWAGRLDDVAIWNNTLSPSSVIGLAKGTYTPLTAPTSISAPAMQTVFTEKFDGGLDKWNVTDRGLENNAPVGYHAPDTTGGHVTLGGTTSQQYWFGSSIESKQRFSSALATTITVDRVSLTGSGTAFRSSVWILGDDFHYLHFSQNVGETGWSWNANDAGGVGIVNPIGSGNNIAELDPLDADLGLHQIKLEIIPTGTLGEVNIFFYLDGALVGGQGFSAFPEDFQIAFTGQARAIGDTVDAVFDNIVVQQVPEPSSVALLALGTVAFAWRRRR